MKKHVVIVAAVLVVCAVAGAHIYYGDRGRWTTPAEITGLERAVAGNILTSRKDPAVRIEFDSSFRHLGGQKFVLYGVADTEQHFFIETTSDDEVQSIYWLQFEAYLPDNNYSYDYEDSPLRLEIGGFNFFTDTAVVQTDPNLKRRRGTDGTLAREFLDSKGYSFPKNYSYSRKVYLTDESRRKELMIIYVDSLAPTGFTGSDLQEGGQAADQWPAIEATHLDKVRRTLSIEGITD